MHMGNIIAGIMAALAAAFSGLTYFRGASAAPEASRRVGGLLSPAEAPGRSFCLMTDVKDHHCREGQLAWFMPPRWGNDQLPIMFVAAVCDFRHPVVWNNGGVACVYTNVRREGPPEQAARDSGAAQKRP